MNEKEESSHIPSTGRAGEALAVAAIFLIGSMASGISQVIPEFRPTLSLPLLLSFYEMRMLWLAAQERKNKSSQEKKIPTEPV